MTRTIAIALSLVALAGCTSAAVDTSCASFGPITYSAGRDSADTVLQVRRHNAAWDALCR